MLKWCLVFYVRVLVVLIWMLLFRLVVFRCVWVVVVRFGLIFRFSILWVSLFM